MARKLRSYSQNQIYHITQRCHKKEFLLKLCRDRNAWRQWLFEAKQRYGLSVLNYMITSNHIHLMVANDDFETIPRAMQLISGRVAQEYNIRKNRRGAFWEDRYHCVPIKDQAHFLECLVYVDLNMVRAGVVNHPSEWLWCGFNEIQILRKRYVIIDHLRLTTLADAASFEDFQRNHKQWVASKLQERPLKREKQWTEGKGTLRSLFWTQNEDLSVPK